MKTSYILLVTVLLLLPFCFTPLFSQQAKAGNEKKITIIKHTVEADGSEVTEAIVKKGKAAENFDVDKYVEENSDENSKVEVVVKDARQDSDHNDWCFGWASSCDNNSAFLGVEEDSDEDATQPGLVVQVTRGSAADRAGLHDNDKILQLNTTKTDKWSDLSKFVSQSKAGDKVKVTYSRNGKTATADVVLGTRKDLTCDTKSEPKGFLGVSEEDEDKAADGVKVSITDGSGADKAGLADGDILLQLDETPVSDFEDITDFMAYTKPGQKIQVAYSRDGQRNKVEVLLGERSNSWTEKNIALPNLKGLDNLNLELPLKTTCTIKEKEACLGVYSNENESHGTRIESFTVESAANEAGMKEGDVITSINGKSVNGHSELWDQIALYKTGDKVDVAYERDGKALQIQATLKACRDNQSRVEIYNDNGVNNKRRFYMGNWDDDDQRQLRETRIIIIRRAAEGDGVKVNLPPGGQTPAQDRSLALTSFRAYPNPSQGQINVEFKGEPVATVVSLLDLTGRQLFREELNAFSGDYSQQFDLTAYAKGTIIIHVQQGDKVFTEQIIVN